MKLSDFVGRPVWLTFGASWCQPCRAENPDIEATYLTVSDAVVVVQVYMSEDAATVKEYRDRVGITYLTVPDPSENASPASTASWASPRTSSSTPRASCER